MFLLSTQSPFFLVPNFLPNIINANNGIYLRNRGLDLFHMSEREDIDFGKSENAFLLGLWNTWCVHGRQGWCVVSPCPPVSDDVVTPRC